MVQLQAPNFDHDIDRSGHSPTAMCQELSTGSDPLVVFQYKSIDYRLAPLVSNRWTIVLGYIPPFGFGNTMTKTSWRREDLYIIGSTGLDWTRLADGRRLGRYLPCTPHPLSLTPLQHPLSTSQSPEHGRI